jgi:hypothetical protein
MRTHLILPVLSVTLIAFATDPGACEQNAAGQESSTVIWVGLASRTKLAKLGPGSSFEGKLERAVYWRDREVFPKGSTVRLVVDKIETRKKARVADDRPFVIRLLAPRHEPVAQFRSASVLLLDGSQVSLRTAFLALTQRTRLHAGAKEDAGKEGSAGANLGEPQQARWRSKRASPWVLTLKVEPEGVSFSMLADVRRGKPSNSPAIPHESSMVPEGTRAPLVLLRGLSASKNHPGDSFQAALLEPVRVGSVVALPQGSLFQGVVAKRVPPRRLSRAGALYLKFTKLTLPNGEETTIAASPVSAEVDQGSHLKMDSEGTLRGGGPGKARFLLDLGVTGGISKVADDSTQLIIELFSSTATDASTAGVARIPAAIASGLFLLTRHGRDVILPPFTEMDVSFSRPVSFGNDPPPPATPK